MLPAVDNSCLGIGDSSSILDPVDNGTDRLEMSLKPYHERDLRLGCQQSIAEASFLVLAEELALRHRLRRCPTRDCRVDRDPRRHRDCLEDVHPTPEST